MKIRQDFVELLPLNTKGLFRLSFAFAILSCFWVRFSALPIVKRLDIGVGLGHKCFSSNFTNVCVTFGILCVHMMDGHVS
jgi:hypothetical protein